MSPVVSFVYVVCCFLSFISCELTTNSHESKMDSFAESHETLVDPSMPIRNATIEFNCTCIITTPNRKGSTVSVPAIKWKENRSIVGDSAYLCSKKAFEFCVTICDKKSNETIYNIDSKSVAMNMVNGVSLQPYLCGLKKKGDTSSMVKVTSEMECIEASATSELFHGQAHSKYMSTTESDCPRHQEEA